MEPKPTNLFVLLLLLLLVLSTVSESTIAKPSSSTPNPSIDFIISSCRVTRYPKLCVKCLAVYASKIHHNDHRLAQAALAATLARAKSTTAFVEKLARARHIKRREYLAVKDCVENLGDGVDRLAESVREMNRLGPGGGGTEFMWRMSNVETWVSAALTDETTCLDGFEGGAMNGVVKAAIRRRVVHVARVTSNTLALVNRFADRHRSSSLNINP